MTNLDIPAGIIIFIAFTIISIAFFGLGIANIVVYATESNVQSSVTYQSLKETSLGVGTTLIVVGVLVAVYVLVIWTKDVSVEKSINFSIFLFGVCLVAICLSVVFTGKILFSDREASRIVSERLWNVQCATFSTLLGLIGLTLLTWIASICIYSKSNWSGPV
jgi:hypothetical protein